MASAQGARSSLVTIYATLRNGHTSQGTGFAVGNDEVATAYHVVYNSIRIEMITSDGRHISDVELRASNPDADLALISAPELHLRPLELVADQIPSTDVDLRMLGSAAGMPGSVFTVRLFRDTLVPIRSFSGIHGRPLIQDPPDLDVLALAGIIYGGISGGPLINDNGNVIGVLSGSRDEGGSYGWAIPAHNLIELLDGPQSAQPVSANLSWPSPAFISSNLRSMEYLVIRDDEMERLVREFPQDLNRLSAANGDIEQAEATFSTFSGSRDFILRLVTALEARRDCDRRLRQAAARLSSLGQRSGLDDESMRRLSRSVAQLNLGHERVATDTFEHMHGIDLDEMIQDLHSLIDETKDGDGASPDPISHLQANLLHYDMGGDFVEWTVRERWYFEAVGTLLQRNYGVVVYIPEG
jgi:hypothetical protein